MKARSMDVDSELCWWHSPDLGVFHTTHYTSDLSRNLERGRHVELNDYDGPVVSAGRQLRVPVTAPLVRLLVVVRLRAVSPTQAELWL